MKISDSQLKMQRTQKQVTCKCSILKNNIHVNMDLHTYTE